MSTEIKAKGVVELKDYVLCKVPEDASGFELWKPYHIKGIPKNGGIGFNIQNNAWDEIELPEGNYKIIGLAKDLTEDQWKEIVEIKSKHSYNVFPDYMNNVFYGVCSTATESGHSLLKHHKLELENTLVLKKVL